MSEITFPLHIVNEDGTALGFEFPENPLKEKWDAAYPPIPMPQYSQVCDGYSCMWCNRCPRGGYWKVPDEDKELWDKYQCQIRECQERHNPSMVASSGGVTNGKNTE